MMVSTISSLLMLALSYPPTTTSSNTTHSLRFPLDWSRHIFSEVGAHNGHNNIRPDRRTTTLGAILAAPHLVKYHLLDTKR